MTTTDNTAAICAGTPTIRVSDNRGEVVRIMRYNRTVRDGTLDEQINRSLVSDDGSVSSLWDPRLFTLWQSNAEQPPNTSTHASLSGRSLRTDSVDAGWQVALYDVEGHITWGKDSRKTVTRTAYDTLGRPVRLFEQADGDAERVAEQLIYGDCDDTQPNPEGDNVRGQLVRHYDEAGLVEFPAFTLLGSPSGQSQQLLANAEGQSDWQGDDEGAWKQALSADTYTSATSYDAIGAWLTQTDAKGNRQRIGYDVAGAPHQSFITLASGAEQTLLKKISYCAAGQMLQEIAGNDVVTDYSYEPQTQRLVGVATTRPVGGSRSTVLQNLQYQYDPVGNILCISDGAQEIRYFRNQEVTAQNGYTYDALYQLLTASGRENAGVAPQGPALPTPIDTNNVVNYSRAYSYDRGGNLFKLVHTGAAPYTNTLFVDENSNRALAQDANSSITQATIGQYFDACGNATQMQPTNALVWNARNQLKSVVLLDRGGASNDNDREIYQYRSGVRVRKQTRRLINAGSNLWQIDDVIYLPGLELRTTSTVDSGGNATASEALQVAAVGAAGRAQIRVLRWDVGKPEDIANDQVRYSFDNQIRSVMLELDSGANILTVEEYYPFGGTAVLGARSNSEAKYKVVRYSAKERDSTGLYYYGYRYYAPWLCRWLNPDPAGMVNGANVYCMVRNNPVEYCDLNGTAKLSRKDIATWYLWQKEALSQLDQLHYALDVSGSRTGVAKASLANLGFLTLRGTAKLAASAAGGAVGTLLVPGPGTFVGGALASLGADEIVDKIQDKAGVSSPHFSTQEAVRALENVDVNIARKKWSDATKGGGIKMGLAARAADSVQNLIFGRAAPVNPVDIGTLLTDSYASAGKMKASKEKKYTSLLDLIDKTQEAIQDDVTEFFHEMEKATGIQDSRVEIPGIVSEYTFGKVSLPLLKVGSANHHVKTKHEASANKMGKMGRDIHASVDSARAKLRNIGQRGAANRP